MRPHGRPLEETLGRDLAHDEVRHDRGDRLHVARRDRRFGDRRVVGEATPMVPAATPVDREHAPRDVDHAGLGATEDHLVGVEDPALAEPVAGAQRLARQLVPAPSTGGAGEGLDPTDGLAEHGALAASRGSPHAVQASG